jgi:hypothetical protein
MPQGDQHPAAVDAAQQTGAPARRMLPRISRRALAAITAVALFAGFADLVRGGITLSAVLLVFSYCVLIPAAILAD